MVKFLGSGEIFSKNRLIEQVDIISFCDSEC